MRMRTRSALYMGLVLPTILMQGGCRNVLGFGTATKFGLDIAQRTDQTIEVSMGYDRTEIASIPAPKREDANTGTSGADGDDAYSVLGTFRVTYGNPFSDEPLVLDQFFATGWAARLAVQDPEMRKFFGREAHDIATKRQRGE